jgi:DNA-binding CsgD family transcriptional regulator
MMQALNAFIGATSDAIIPADASEHFASLAEQLGFGACLLIEAPVRQPKTAAPIITWRSSGTFKHYNLRTPFVEHPLIKYAAAVDAPFDVPSACAALGEREDNLRRLLSPATQDKHIVILPVHRHGDLVLYAACAGDKPEDNAHTRAILHASAHVTYDLLAALIPNKDITHREAECLKAIARGHSYKAAGRLLGVAERTVRGAVASAKRKLHARTRAEVIAKAMAG